MAVTSGDTVRVQYIGRLDDGTVFDSSNQQGGPLEFEVGGGQMLRAFEAAVLGMERDETKKITLDPENAYGPRDERLVQEIPRSDLPADQPLEVGMVVVLRSHLGYDLPALIKMVTASTVTLDFNHPLAGQTLHFEITVCGVDR